MKLDCDVIRDLLPLYAEQLTSLASTALVEEHLQTCTACRAALEQMQRPVPVRLEPQPDAPLKRIRTSLRYRRAATIFLSVLAVFCLLVLTAWMGTAQISATVEQTAVWTYNRRENDADLCILEVQGEGVWLTMEQDFNWGEPVITVQAVRYRFPHVHAAWAGLFGTDTASKTVTVSNTQLLTVECADDTLYYRQGQQVYGYLVNGTVCYGTEQQLGLYPRV